MEFIRSWKFMALIIGLLMVSAVIGIVIGVTTHTEPGLLETIDDAGPRWSRERMPLKVCTRSYADTDIATARRVVEDAIETTNDRLGFVIFEPSLVHSSCDVTVEVGVPAEIGWMDPGGDAQFHRSVPVPSCSIRTSNTGTSELTNLVIQHELGHCLGLAHDTWGGSIMRRVMEPTPPGEYPPRITDSDRDLLIELYAP